MNSSRFYIGVFLVTSSTLMLQLAQTRILSVVLWYHLAFFVISIAMFGLTAGAVWVYLRKDRFTAETLPRDLARSASAMAVATAVSLAVQMTLAPVFLPTLTFAVVWLELALVISAPFFFSGIVISLALTRSPFPVGRVYGVDMLGAAAGCPGAVLLLSTTDGPSAVLFVAAVTAIAAMFFARSASGKAPAGETFWERVVSRPGRLALILLAVALSNAATSHGLRPLYVKDALERRQEGFLFEEWNSFSRVTAISARGKSLYGQAPKARKVKEADLRVLTIDGRASTPMYHFSGDVSAVDFLKLDVTNLAYYLPHRGRAAVIGVGGGRDVLSAWVFGRRDVTGVEINPIFVKLLEDDPDFAAYAGLKDLDGVRLVVDEARSWFARSDETFDVLQMSMIDTWASTGAGAFTLSENGLYTMEAWDVFLRRLKTGGVFTVSRWYAAGEVNETGRMVSLAAATLMRRGVAKPGRHIFVASTPRVATLILSPSPFSGEDLKALERACEDLGYEILVSPGRTPQSAILGEIVAASSLEDLERRLAGQSLDLSPPTDDRPFFFNQLPFYRPLQVLRLATGSRPAGVVAGNLQAAATLLVILAVSLALVLATIVLPLRSAIRSSRKDLVVAGTGYFLLIGFGFMAFEIGLLQRMSVFLGHPVYSLAVVLFSIILTTGLGSLISEKLVLDTWGRRIGWSALTGGYLLSIPLWWSKVFLAFDSSPLWLRIALCVVVILPIGLLLGFGFPTGMRMISAIDNRPTPWFWGINGAAGVLGSSLGLALSIAWGINATVIFAGVCYLLLMAPPFGIGLAKDGA